MRTTVILDPDVARLLEEEALREGKSLDEVANEALRRALGPSELTCTHLKPYSVRRHQTTLLPAVDAGSFNHLADELEDEEILAKLRKHR